MARTVSESLRNATVVNSVLLLIAFYLVGIHGSEEVEGVADLNQNNRKKDHGMLSVTISTSTGNTDVENREVEQLDTKNISKSNNPIEDRYIYGTCAVVEMMDLKCTST